MRTSFCREKPSSCDARACGFSSFLQDFSLIGCQDQPATGPARNVPSAAASMVAGAAVDRPDEAEMAAFARAVPGLGGYYFGADGDLVVNLTPAADVAAAQAALASVARRGSGRVRASPATYTFLQLQAWRDALVEQVVDISGVTFLDLDEVANRVAVGIAEPRARGAVLEVARAAGLPAAAVSLVQAGRVQSNALEEYAPYIHTWPMQGDSVTSYRRPLEGGLKITYRRVGGDPDNAITCTLGFVARLNGVRVAITASHCSQRHWDQDQTSYFQAAPGAGRYFGYEYRDRNGSSCGFLSPNVCRNSDASAVFIESDVRDSLGYIARPIGPPPEGTSPYGIKASSLVVDPANQRFRISGRGSPIASAPVDKVGVRTGWTRGMVERTCVDMPADRSWSWLRCQGWASLSSARGDSGAPVFAMNADGTVTLLGMLWGRVTSDGQEYASFSSLGRIEMDLGDLQVIPASPPAGGEGPVEPGDGDTCPPNCVT